MARAPRAHPYRPQNRCCACARAAVHRPRAHGPAAPRDWPLGGETTQAPTRATRAPVQLRPQHPKALQPRAKVPARTLPTDPANRHQRQGSGGGFFRPQVGAAQVAWGSRATAPVWHHLTGCQTVPAPSESSPAPPWFNAPADRLRGPGGAFPPRSSPAPSASAHPGSCLRMESAGRWKRPQCRAAW
ncbi:hypothetical protein SDC9_103257 [bioreactor metagenome]|uniref:Uncharacterized protein n=1 Tax=bioreactor metagenome TaxID=1076179 RepID=A0A645AZW9_9ZZZZ